MVYVRIRDLGPLVLSAFLIPKPCVEPAPSKLIPLTYPHIQAQRRLRPETQKEEKFSFEFAFFVIRWKSTTHKVEAYGFLGHRGAERGFRSQGSRDRVWRYGKWQASICPRNHRDQLRIRNVGFNIRIEWRVYVLGFGLQWLVLAFNCVEIPNLPVFLSSTHGICPSHLPEHLQFKISQIITSFTFCRKVFLNSINHRSLQTKCCLLIPKRSSLVLQCKLSPLVTPERISYVGFLFSAGGYRVDDAWLQLWSW